MIVAIRKAPSARPPADRSQFTGASPKFCLISWKRYYPGMGQGVTYCDGCGGQVLEQDLQEGRAVALASRTFCRECVAQSALKPAKARPAARPASRPPSRVGAPSGASTAKPLAAVACVLAAGLCGAILLAQKSKHEPAPRPAVLPAAAPPAVAPAAAPDPPPQPRPAEKPRDSISPEKAGDFVGKTATVEFTVVAVSSSSRSDTVFLKNTARTGKGSFAAVIFRSDRRAFEKAFGEDLEAAFKGKKIRVTGEVKSYRGSQEIVLDEPGQIQIVR